MRDNWNHPSVAIWDATNESWLPEFTTKIIPAVRSFDLSNRPWENSYNVPAGANDPVEDHQYLFFGMAMNDPHSSASEFNMTDLESMLGPGPDEPTSKTGHAMILNEYGWLWLNRDGTPTLLTRKLYPKLLTKIRLRSDSHCRPISWVGKRKFWRAYRRYAGVLHFVYLRCDLP
jgi:beta-galactosidase